LTTTILIIKPLIVILGAGFNFETFQLVTKLQGQKMWLDGKNYRDLTGGFSTDSSSRDWCGQMADFCPSKQMRYDTQSARDANRVNTFGIAYSQAIDANYSPSFFVSAIFSGAENVTQ
jgi:hypothetical protein